MSMLGYVAFDISEENWMFGLYAICIRLVLHILPAIQEMMATLGK